MRIRELTDTVLCVISIRGKKVRRRFDFDPEDRASRMAAKQAAIHWGESRESLTRADKGLGIGNLDESVSVVKGNAYLYVRLRKNRQLVKSISTGRLLDRSPEGMAEHRKSAKYTEAVAALRELAATLDD